ncbi:hypothetical protein GIB67_042468 [Kingdonia uniflora]|uniref:Beta-galactosidase beta-sandwich domain-containing protein n=1 Tax=Kingdonia uniflora TaxID=39325 RepID=A0A7J7M0W0_9MAGN|nr:hypothetical protein GIB67_042468 [Kingdonia uniflora]
MLKKVLTEGNVSTTNVGVGVNATIYSANGTSGSFLSNKNATSSATVTFEGNKYSLPAWSVSILPDCKKEVYNTAKVRRNLDQAKTALEALIKREEKKREVMESEVSLQRIEMKYKSLVICVLVAFQNGAQLEEDGLVLGIPPAPYKFGSSEDDLRDSDDMTASRPYAS